MNPRQPPGMPMSKKVQLATAVAMALALFVAKCPAQSQTPTGSVRESALALEQQGKNAEAEAQWTALLKVHPADSEAYAHLGLLEARQEHYKQAVTFYRKALVGAPKMQSLHLNLGLALFKAGDLKAAILEFNPLLKTAAPASPDADRLNILLGMAHYGVQEYASAVPYLKAGVARDPQNLELRLTLAHSCLWSKQYQCVLDAYHEMLLQNAESAEADMLAGEALDSLKDPVGAIKQFRAAAQANPKEPEVHFGLGYLLWTQRQYPEAATELQAELANDPDHPMALTYLGDADSQLNKPELARPLFEKAIRINPSIELAHLDLGVLMSDAGRNDDALRELQVAARLAPNDTDVHWRLGRLYRKMGRMQEAKLEFNKASSLHKIENDAVIQKMSPSSRPPSQNASHP